jgi:hypothetical protein
VIYKTNTYTHLTHSTGKTTTTEHEQDYMTILDNGGTYDDIPSTQNFNHMLQNINFFNFYPTNVENWVSS